MKKLITLLLFAFSMLVIGSAFATIEKQKVKDERTVQTDLFQKGIEAGTLEITDCEYVVEGKKVSPEKFSSLLITEKQSLKKLYQPKKVEPRTDLHLDPGLK